jgi:hypothetical protein
VASWLSDEVVLLHGKGAGVFDAPVSLATGKGPRSLAIGDLNADGLADVV